MTWFAHPPVNLEAEKALLGALMVDNRCHARIAVPLAAEHFAAAAHGAVYAACVAVIESGRPVDGVTLHAFAAAHPALEGMHADGAVAYLVELMGSVVTLINVPEYARVIVDLARRRTLMEMAQALLTAAANDDLTADVGNVLAEHEARLGAFVLGAEGDAAGPRTWAQETQRAAAAWEAAQKGTLPPAVTTGLADLDAATGGLFPGDLVLIGARPSMGKTALALNMAVAAAESFTRPDTAEEKAGQKGGMVLFFSLEQPGHQLVAREAAARTGLGMPAIRAGRLDDRQLSRLVDTAIGRGGLPILLDSRGGLTVGRLAATARRHRNRDGVRLIVVDYLQFLGFDDRYRGNRTYEVAEATRALKALAKELDLPIVLLSQLNRAAEARDNRRPQLADLRESGSIEQDADVVLLLYREDYYLERDGEPARRAGDSDDDHQTRLARHRARAAAVAGRAEILIAKQRNGPCRTVPVRFDPQRMRFSDL